MPDETQFARDGASAHGASDPEQSPFQRYLELALRGAILGQAEPLSVRTRPAGR
jgi:hypothetical protein